MRSANSSRPRLSRRALAAAAAPLALAVLSAAGAQPMRVLFIGNSLTLSHGLPAMVEQLSRLAGGPAIEATAVAKGGYSLEDHWKEGEAVRMLRSGTWTAVVLQQGPSSRSDSRILLRDYVARFHAEAQTRRIMVALYMVWPPREGPGTFDQVAESYTLAARDVGGRLLPVGQAFRAALASDPGAPILAGDGFHPTPLGSALAAIVVHQRLTGRDTPFVPERLPATASSPAVHLDPATRANLRRAAIAATTDPK